MDLVGRQSETIIGSKLDILLCLPEERPVKLDVDAKYRTTCTVDHPIVGVGPASSVVLHRESVVSESLGGQCLEVLFSNRSEHHLRDALSGPLNAILGGFSLSQPLVEVPSTNGLDPTTQVISW